METFTHLFGDLGPTTVMFVLIVAIIAGLVKGVVGFAMPMILISGLSSIVAPQVALAALILPTLVTNGFQALRQGRAAALSSIKKFRIFLIVGGVTLVIAAQFVRALPPAALYLVIGVPIIVFAGLQLSGRGLRLPSASPRVEATAGGVAGVMAGLSGSWGPPTVAFLTAADTAKTDQIRIQGVIYGLGSIALTLAHMQSGVLNWQTAPLSALLIVPALIGMAIGTAIQDRIDQQAFRKVTLWVLLIVGLNLIRRAVF